MLAVVGAIVPDRGSTDLVANQARGRNGRPKSGHGAVGLMTASGRTFRFQCGIGETRSIARRKSGERPVKKKQRSCAPRAAMFARTVVGSPRRTFAIGMEASNSPSQMS